MNDDASLAKNSAAWAISSLRPQRAMGTRDKTEDSVPSSPRRNSVRSVSIQPGTRVLTRIPW